MPVEKWVPILKHVVEDELLKQWIHETLLTPKIAWMGPKGVKISFIRKTIPPNYEVTLRAELAKLRNKDVMDLQNYFAKFKDKCYRLGYDMTDQRTIHECEFKLCTEAKEIIRSFKMSKLYLVSDYQFSSIQELQNVAELALKLPIRNIHKSENRNQDSNDNNKSKKRFHKSKKKNNSEYETTEVKQDKKQKKGDKKNKSANVSAVKADPVANVSRVSQDAAFDKSKKKMMMYFTKLIEKDLKLM